jgi:hypothetical protein
MPVPRALVLAMTLAALLIPTPGIAGILTFEVTDGGELAVRFGLLPFQASGDLSNDVLEGVVTLTSGPSTVSPDSDTTDYEFGAGTVAILLNGISDPVSGAFAAPTLPFGFTVCEGCDTLFGGGLADDFDIGFGPGLLDQSLARFLGVRRATLGGGIDFGLEAIDGSPDDELRTGFDHRGFATLTIVTREAPEPATGLLLLTAAAGWLVRRRRA